nr:RNA-directed DNA polymerase, eukaryota, reverse transcriptase zinc-binding domain protein [Tanacetum cinerariifolium]
GLGVGSLHAKNLGLIGKWKWRYLAENDALWRNVIKRFYGDDGAFGSPNSTFGNMGVWCNILKAVKFIKAIVPNFNNSFKLKVCNRMSVSFWRDPWCGDGSRLMEVFTRLYTLDSYQDCKNSWIPRKVNVCVWRSSLNRLATGSNLSIRGVPLASYLCPFCESDVEDLDHCLINCPKVLPVWRKIWSWWCLDPPVTFPSSSISDIALGIQIQMNSDGIGTKRTVTGGGKGVQLLLAYRHYNTS